MEQNRQTSPTPSSRADDEISLIDLWLILVRYKRVFFAVFLLCLALGLVIALTTPRTYTYSTSIEIGRRIEKDTSISIEPPEAVAAKLNESYIPLALHEYKKRNPDNESFYKINARIPQNSGLVIIETEGTTESAAPRLALLEKVTMFLKNDHDRITDLERARMDTKLQEAKLELEALKGEEKTIGSKIKRLNALEQLLTEQVAELRRQIQTSLQYREKAVAEAVNEPQAMTLLLIDSELEKNRTRLSELERELHFDLKNEREDLQQTLADNRRSQELKIQDIKALGMEQSALMDTRVLIEPTQSLLPKGPRRTLIVALAGVLGLMAGLFSAFFAAFLAKARQQTTEDAV